MAQFPISDLSKVDTYFAEELAKLGLSSVQDVFYRELLYRKFDMYVDTKNLRELLPVEVRDHPSFEPFLHGLLDLESKQSFEGCLSQRQMLKPDTGEQFRKRLVFEELLANHLNLMLLRRKIQSETAVRLSANSQLQKDFLDRLSFKLTKAQLGAYAEIVADFAKGVPMLRLLHSEVRAGKTVVAALAILAVVAEGKQAVVLAPTEELAEQYFSNFSEWFAPLGISLSVFTGEGVESERRDQLAAIANGKIQVVIGIGSRKYPSDTTRLFFEHEVMFADLVLVITEDHNIFSARHHYSLGKNGVIDTSDISTTDLEKRCRPHQLLIASTPIPLSFVKSIYVDLDCSTIDELPSDPVLVTIEMAQGSSIYINKEFADNAYKKVLEQVRLTCEQGKQVYWVFNEISDGGIDVHSYLEARVSVKYDLPQLRVEFLPSIGNSKDAATLQAFRLKELDVLGVNTDINKEELNLPNAGLIIIENAEFLNLTNLHQLRALVSHGPEAGHCILLYRGEGALNDIKKKRLQTLCESNDGFYLAEQDLLLRSAREEWYWGCTQFKFATIEHDFALFPMVKHCAELLITQHPTACEEIIQRWLCKSYVQL